MIRHIRSIILISALAIASAIPALSQTSLKVSLDSAYLLMGKATPLHIELIAPANAEGTLVIPADTLSDKVEILNIQPADTTDIRNGRIQVNQQVTIQSFDSGTYILNPILYVQGNETIASNRPVLKVLPAMVDSLETIHDYADVADVDRHLIDYMPDFLADYGLWILAVIVILLLGYYTLRRITSGKPEAKEVKLVIPPYELAMRELESLRSDKLCEQGREKEYYTRLTDILRQYLQGRFGINAMEMTSTQIRHILELNEETRLSKANMERVLETADFVKFAKVRPLPDDNAAAYNSAIRFVEDTKPRPVVPPAEESGDSAQDSNKPSTTDN